MKKIISLVAACAMVATMFTSFVTVSADIAPTTTAVAQKLTNDEFKAIAESDIPEGYAVYNVTFKLANFGELTSYKEGLKYSGRKLKSAQVSIPNVSKYVDTDILLTMSNVFNAASVSEGVDTSIDTFTVAKAADAVGTAYPMSVVSEPVTAIDDVYTILMGLKTTESITMDYTFVGGINTYTKGTPSNPEDFTINGTITFGTPAPAAKLDKVVISGATATTLTVGDEVTLTAKAYNDDETEKATAIAWTVEGDAVTVADGLVKAVKEGTATVTATAVDGEITKSASVTFTVETEKLPALPEVTVAGGDVAGQEVKSGENTIGYLWKAIFNAATIKDKYIATFKSGAETNAATLKGFAAYNIEGEGNVSVIVALNTAKAAVTLGITE